MPNSNCSLPLFPWITVLSLSEISVCIKQFDGQNIENPLLKLPERYHPPVQKESSADALRRLNFSRCKPQSRVINDPAKAELLCECIICHQLLGSKFLQHTHFSLYLQNRLGVFLWSYLFFQAVSSPALSLWLKQPRAKHGTVTLLKAIGPVQQGMSRV